LLLATHARREREYSLAYKKRQRERSTHEHGRREVRGPSRAATARRPTLARTTNTARTNEAAEQERTNPCSSLIEEKREEIDKEM